MRNVFELSGLVSVRDALKAGSEVVKQVGLVKWVGSLSSL
jgi:hypothetical protein